MLIRVKSPDARPRLTGLPDTVIHSDQRVIIKRHGKEGAVPASRRDPDRIWKDEDEELYGPINPASGRRRGAGWVNATGWTRAKKAPVPDAEDTQSAAPGPEAPEPRRGWLAWLIR